MALTSSLETERKYDVDESVQVPDLGALGTVETAEPITLRAVYYDSTDGRLAARLITLRRRTGGSDDGWHLKTPAEGGRTEYHAPLHSDAGEPPTTILEPVRALLRRRAVVEIARLVTQRTRTILRGDSGEALAEIADDVVSATDVQTGILRLWREWEVELLPGAPGESLLREALLDAVEEKLRAAGAVPSASASKLARATGRSSLSPDGNGRGSGDSVSGASPALEVATVVVADLLERILSADPLVRRDEPDAVHSMRILVRRLRSVLGAFGEIFDPAVTRDVREHLRQLGDVLGSARDTEVRRQRAVDAIAAVGDRPGTQNESQNPAATLQRRLVDDVLGEYGAHFNELSEFLTSDGYFDLLDELELLVARPPVTTLALAPAKKVLRRAIRREARRARRRLKAAVAAGGAWGAGHDAQKDAAGLEALHSARKAVRRLRYLSEALSGSVAPVFGGKTVALGDAAKQLQDAIGEHRDATLFIAHLDLLSREATEAGEDAAGFGTLAAREQRNADAALSGLKKDIGALTSAARA